MINKLLDMSLFLLYRCVETGADPDICNIHCNDVHPKYNL